MGNDKKALGCLLSPIDLRDYQFKDEKIMAKKFPDAYSLDMSNVKIKNQRDVCSCVAHALSSILEYHDKGRVNLSTNFIYGIHHRLYLSTGPGMTLRNALRIASNHGDMTEEDCPGNTEIDEVYKIASTAFNVKHKKDTALKYKIKQYVKLSGQDSIKFAIMNYGPVIAGVKWHYTTIFDKLTKFIKMDKTTDYGFHAIVIYGWDEKGWLCQNSWGEKWGDKGRFKMLYSDGPRESYALIDDELLDSSTITIPTHNLKLLDSILKIINKVINVVLKRN